MHARVVMFEGGNPEQMHRMRTGLMRVGVAGKLQAIMGAQTSLLIL
jgi:hypothetical protein